MILTQLIITYSSLANIAPGFSMVEHQLVKIMPSGTCPCYMHMVTGMDDKMLCTTFHSAGNYHGPVNDS